MEVLECISDTCEERMGRVLGMSCDYNRSYRGHGPGPALANAFFYKVASGFLDQSKPDGGDYKHTKFSLSYVLDKPSPGHLFLAM